MFSGCKSQFVQLLKDELRPQAICAPAKRNALTESLSYKGVVCSVMRGRHRSVHKGPRVYVVPVLKFGKRE
jgi:hypothetical protein